VKGWDHRGTRTSRLAGAAVCALAGLLTPASAAAGELVFRPCVGTPDFECSSLAVPLDPEGRRTATVDLHVRRLVETREASDVLVALAGGPGQSSTRFIEDFAFLLADALENRQLVVVDTRGTGDSGALRCRELDRAPPAIDARRLSARVGRCAARLGDARRLYTTTEVVADLDAVREALGVQRISIFGVSYGAYVAQRYARRFPQNVDRLVLDSPVAQGQGDAFDLAAYRAAGRALRRLCRERACRQITPDPVADIRRLARRVARHPLRGRVFDHRGRAKRLRLMTQAQLFDLVVSSDFSPGLRAALPAAIRSALRGDAAPLLRLLALDEGTADPGRFDEQNEDAREFSNALFFATTCQEKPLPWGTPETALGQRSALRRAALAELPGGAFSPFGRAAAESTQVGTSFCRRWPPTSVAPVPPPGPIDAPALVLSGLMDVRTPTAEAMRAAALIPDASLVRVPGAAHSLVSSGLPCVQIALTRFFTGGAVGNPCAGRLPPQPARPAPVPLPARRLGELMRGGPDGRRGRALAAAIATIRDAVDIAGIQGLLDGRFRFGGLRGGRACVVPGEADAAGRRSVVIAFVRDRYARGLAITGRAVVRRGRIVRMRLSTGARQRTRLRLVGSRVRVVMDGRRSHVRVRASQLEMPPLAVARALSSSVRQRCR
jgi:pimeloyl-ACP methyl ester carboxylesterase